MPRTKSALIETVKSDGWISKLNNSLPCGKINSN